VLVYAPRAGDEQGHSEGGVAHGHALHGELNQRQVSLDAGD
jgi:hypothetical protein